MDHGLAHGRVGELWTQRGSRQGALLLSTTCHLPPTQKDGRTATHVASQKKSKGAQQALENIVGNTNALF